MTPKKPNDKPNLEVMATDIAYIANDLTEIKSMLTNNYVTNDRFIPVKNIAYGFLGIFFTSVVGALVFLLVKKG